jgi:hypothetical protein
VGRKEGERVGTRWGRVWIEGGGEGGVKEGERGLCHTEHDVRCDAYGGEVVPEEGGNGEAGDLNIC